MRKSWYGNSRDSSVGMQYETESEGHLPFLQGVWFHAPWDIPNQPVCVLLDYINVTNFLLLYLCSPHIHTQSWGAVPTQTEQTVFHCSLLCIVSVFEGNTGMSSYHIHIISHQVQQVDEDEQMLIEDLILFRFENECIRSVWSEIKNCLSQYLFFSVSSLVIMLVLHNENIMSLCLVPKVCFSFADLINRLIGLFEQEVLLFKTSLVQACALL